MKRRTANFIMRQNGEKTGLFSIIDKKTFIILVSVVLGALVLGGLYLWYVKNYANARKVDLEADPKITYELQEKTSENGIVKDYLWSRTKELMLKNASNDTLIVSSVTLPGTLIDQEQSKSGEYLLSDQALLLKAYVGDNERIKAKALYDRVNKDIDITNASTTDKIMWLDAFVRYYSSYGTSKDEKKLSAYVDEVFDEQGFIKPSSMEVSKYSGQAYVSSANTDDALSTGSAIGDLEAGGSNGSYKADEEKITVDCVLISCVDLRLIRELENNNFLPEGSYERNLSVVKGAKISDDIPLYAYAYEVKDGEINYLYSSLNSGTINITETVETFKNLALVNELPEESYSWLKTTLFGNDVFYDTYFMMTGRPDGNDSFDSYVDIATIALIREDSSTFDLCMRRIGNKVATLNTSPALSMVFRSEGGRNITYAKDNLEIYLLIR